MKLVNAYKLILILALTQSFNRLAYAQMMGLEQCIDTALAHNVGLQVSRNNIQIGLLKEKEARANMLPRVSANADYRYYTDLPYQLMPLNTFNPQAPEGQYKEAQFGVPHNINANIQYAMPLYSPQLFGAMEATGIGYDIAHLQHAKTEEQVIFEIATLYYNAVILSRQLQFIDSNLINSNRLLNNMELLREHLLAKPSDVAKVRIQSSQLESQRQAIQLNYDQLMDGLKLVMGISREFNIEIDTEISGRGTDHPVGAEAIDIRLLSAKSQLLSSELRTLNKARYLPSVNLQGTYGINGLGYDEKPNDFLNFYPIGFVGLQVSYPLFAGTVNQKKIGQKKIEINSNEIQLKWAAEQQEVFVANTTEKIIVTQKFIETRREQLKMAEDVYRQTLIQQKEGTAALADVLLADNALREAQQILLSAIVDYLKADLELKKLSGNMRSNTK